MKVKGYQKGSSIRQAKERTLRTSPCQRMNKGKSVVRKRGAIRKTKFNDGD